MIITVCALVIHVHVHIVIVDVHVIISLLFSLQLLAPIRINKYILHVHITIMYMYNIGCVCYSGNLITKEHICYACILEPL